MTNKDSVHHKQCEKWTHDNPVSFEEVNMTDGRSMQD